jgi:hypothetical protein
MIRSPRRISFALLAISAACDAAPSTKTDTKADTKADTKVVTTTFSNEKKAVSLSLPTDYGFCAAAGCGRSEGPVPEDACSNKEDPIPNRCLISLAPPEVNMDVPVYMLESGDMPKDGDKFNYSMIDAKWKCHAKECTAVENHRKHKSLDIARAISVGNDRAIIVSGYMSYVMSEDVARMQATIEATLKTVTVRAAK